MKIKITAVMLLALIAVLSGCGDKDDISGSTSEKSASETSQISGEDNKDEESEQSAADMSQLTAEEFYNKYAEEVIEVVNAKDYEAVYTEAETAALFNEREFTQCPVTYEYSISGEYGEETEISADSDEIHPIYQTYYVTENEDIWILYLIGDAMCAEPISYNMNLDSGETLMISETEEFLSYDCEENKFFRTVPKEESVELKVVDEINAEILEEISKEEF